MKSEKGFTLIEMMIVMLVVTILLLIAIPNVSSHYKKISEKGCEGLLNMVQAQISAYWLDHYKYPDSIEELKSSNYLDPKKNYTCPNGKPITIVDGSAKAE